MRAVLGRFFLALSVLAASLVFSTASPATATTPSLCPPGTYVSSYDASICNSTPPGTYTDTAGATEPIPCDPGTYQPYYGKTSCLNTPPGTATVSAGGEVPNDCSPGTFANNEGSNICLSAPSGMYIPDSGASAAIPCPATPLNAASRATTGNKKVIDCFAFSGNSLVLPTANSTVDNEVRFEFFVNTGIASGDNVRITFTSTLGPDPYSVHQIVAQVNLESSDPKRGTITVPLAWQNTAYFRGCPTSCDSAARITSLPLSTYNIKIEVKDNSTPSAWVDLGTSSAVQVTDTITTKPQMYLQGWSYSTDSATVGLGLPENRMANSAIVKISDAPKYLSPTITKTYTLGPGSLTDYIDLRFSGTQTSPHVVAASNEVVTPGQWWVSVSYQDASGNPLASDEWNTPMLVTRDCPAGNFSVSGIAPCIPAPAGYFVNYPSLDSFDSETKAFSPSRATRSH